LIFLFLFAISDISIAQIRHLSSGLCHKSEKNTSMSSSVAQTLA
jgi:hypothetical protein